MQKSADLFWTIQNEIDLLHNVRADDLSPQEEEKYSTLKVDKRRREWLAGRYLLKKLLQTTYTDVKQRPLNEIIIIRDESGAPVATVSGNPITGVITLSHSQGMLFAAYSPSEELLPGVDVEKVEPRDPAFLEDFFTHQERVLIYSNPGKDQLIISLIWSAKEAVMKSLRLGMQVVARDVNILISSEETGSQAWKHATARYAPSGQQFNILWQVSGNSVFTISHAAHIDIIPAEVIF